MVRTRPPACSKVNGADEAPSGTGTVIVPRSAATLQVAAGIPPNQKMFRPAFGSKRMPFMVRVWPGAGAAGSNPTSIGTVVARR